MLSTAATMAHFQHKLWIWLAVDAVIDIEKMGATSGLSTIIDCLSFFLAIEAI